MDDVLTLDEVATFLKLTAETNREKRRQVRELITNGQLRAINDKVGPRRLTVSRWEVMRYVGHPDYTPSGDAA